MSETIKNAVEHCIWDFERFEDNPKMRSDQMLGITRAEGEAFVEIEAQLTAERDELQSENDRLQAFEPKILTSSTLLDHKILVAKEVMSNMVVAFSSFNGKDTNYSETEIEYEGDKYIVTVQNAKRPTAHDLRKKAEAERDALAERVRELETLLTDAIPFIGWGTSPDGLVDRCQDAVDYGKEQP